MSFKIHHAVLHVLDFESGNATVSQSELDMEDRQVKSYVQRMARKCVTNVENRHGEFEDGSAFAASLGAYVQGGVGFMDFGAQVAELVWDSLRLADPVENVDVLVADFEDDLDAQEAAKAAAKAKGEGEAATLADAAYKGQGERRVAVVIMPSRTAYAHEIRSWDGAVSAQITRHNAAIPAPTQKLDTYAVVCVRTGEVDFVEKPRTIAGAATNFVSDVLCRCSSRQSTRETIEDVQQIVVEAAREYGINPTVAVAKAKAQVVAKAAQDEPVEPQELCRKVFKEEPQAAERAVERVTEMVERRQMPEQVEVKRSVATRIAKSQRIRTDTGIEVIFPAEYCESGDYIRFTAEADGSYTISISNIGSIENR